MAKLYTDGGCSPNPGPGGWAFILEDGENTVDGAGGAMETTNNRMEMIAVIRGLEAAKAGSAVELVADSQYVVKGLTEWSKGWKASGWTRKVKGKSKPVMNVDLWKRLDELAGGFDLTCTWVKGHSGHPRNEQCDRMVNQVREALLRGEPVLE
jgi:ribonuclease HI